MIELLNLYNEMRNGPVQPAEGSVYYDVLKNSKCRVVERAEEGSNVILKYEDTGVERIFSEDFWRMAKDCGRFKTKSYRS